MAAPQPAPGSRPGLGRPAWPVVAILVGGALLSLALSVWMRQTLAYAEATRFERLALRVEREVAERFLHTANGLKGARAAFVANQALGVGVSRAMFSAWVGARGIDRDFPGVRGFGFIQPVDRGNLARFIAAERADGAGDFTVRHLEEAGHETLYVIKYIEPVERNAGAVGLDVGSEPRRRRAIERAIQSGTITITEPIVLVQDGQRTPGFLICIPFYRGTEDPPPADRRVAAAAGVLYAPVVARELLGPVAEVSGHQIDVEVMAGPPETAHLPENLVFDSDGSRATTAAGAHPRRHRIVRSIDVFGSPFTLELKASEDFEGAATAWQPWLLLVAGLLVTGLLARLVLQKSTEKTRAEAYAASMTADLERLALVARRTSDAVVITDPQRRMTWVNEAFTTITGYGFDEAMGQSPGRLLQFEGTDAAEVARMREALDAGMPFRGELLNRGKNGRVYWIALEIQPLHGPDGTLSGFMAVEVDVTERKAIMQRLSDARVEAQRLAVVARHTSNAVVITDRALRIEWVNKAFELLYGYSAEQAIGRTPGELLGSPLAPPEALAELARAAQAGVGCRVELVNRRADGTDVWVDTEVQPRLDAAGRVDGFVEIQSDITARRRAEHEAQRSSALLRNAIEAIDEAFVLYDADDRLVLCNERYRQVYAHSADLIVPGARFEDIIRGGAQRGQYAEAIGRVEAWVAERMATHRAGTTARIQRLQDGRTLRIVERRLADGHVVGFRVDVTELAQARESAERARHEASQALARLQAIYDMLPIGIAITDPQGRIIDCNPASERLLGISKAEHLSRNVDGREWTVLREDGSPLPAEEFASVRALREQRAVHDAVMQVVTPQHAVWLSVSALPARHPELGVVIGYVDISEQRAQEAALRQAKSAAEHASLAKSQFLANMSHEIRTPMNAILGMLRLLRRTRLDLRQVDYVEKTEGAARSLLGLLNDVLDYSKVEAGKMTLDPQPFSLDRLLADLSVIFSANVGDKPVEVLFDVGPGVPDALVGDALRLQQVLINLGGNAIKFTARGEVVLGVRLESLEGGTARLAFAVRDTGIGIARENIARIFNGFTQAEASTTRRFGGTGLGVAISQRIVALMGGELRVDSEPGRGSVFGFTITLPVAGEATAATLVPRPRHVLVVDDHPLARELLAWAARSLGWRVDEARDAHTALQAYDTAEADGDPHDALFVDWMMPGTDGWALVKAVRERPRRSSGPPVRIVMVTAHGREGLHGRSPEEQASIDAFLVKPITAGMLSAALDRPEETAGPAPSAAAAATRPLAGMRLLVAEDNLNNQQVARELLEDEGAVVDLVGSGLEAIQALEASHDRYALVLMDLQMPEMDGLEATRIIRTRLGLRALPIVAMTANAMASDRAACLEAGMNDHVGKPFDIAWLVQVIRSLTGERGEAAARPRAESASADPQTPDVAAVPGIDLRTALQRLGGRRAVYLRLAGGFIPDLAGLEQELADAAAEGRHDDFLRKLHTAKGVAATLGMSAVAGALAHAEASARQLPADAGAQAWADVAAPLAGPIREGRAALGELIERQRGDEAARSPNDVDTGALRAALQRLRALLLDCDLAAITAVDELAHAFGDGLPGWVAELRRRVESMEFEEAARMCSERI